VRLEFCSDVRFRTLSANEALDLSNCVEHVGADLDDRRVKKKRG
jgi:hypothetical protein